MRRSRISATFIFLLYLLLSPVIHAADAHEQILLWQEPNWDRELAVLAAARVNSSAETEHLFELASAPSGTETLDALTRLASRPDWPAPAIEAALLRFTNQLRQLPPFSVDPAVLDFLQRYRNLTLVADAESSRLGVPLYPIRSAASGLLHYWTRQQAARDAAALLRQDPQQLLSVYISNPDVNVRAGIEAALSTAGRPDLRALLEHGLPRLSGPAELTGLLGKSAIYLGDIDIASDILIRGRGHSLTEITRLASRRFVKTELGEILLSGIGAAPASTAAMLIAELAPYCIDLRDISSALMNALEHPELGSTAALSLAQWGSDQQREALRALAARDQSSLAAKRAQTALSLSRARPARRLHR